MGTGSPLRTTPGGRPRAAPAADLITVLLAAWMMVGLFIDGWAHNNLAELETFFTPWHAVFYSGFLATAAWMGWLVVQGLRAGRGGLSVVPRAYGYGVLGVVLFALGGLADMAWHTFLGIEQDIKALSSPPHLLLFVGGMLVVTTPFRAAWSLEPPPPRLGAFVPALLSLALAMSFVFFMFMYVWAFDSLNVLAVGPVGDLANTFADVPRAAREVSELVEVRGITNILLTNALLMAPVILILRRWQPPFGSVTVLFGVVATLMAGLNQFRTAHWIVMALGGGVIADILIAVWRPSPQRVGSIRLVAAVVPIVLWGSFLLVVALRWGLAWSLELWAGVPLWAGLAGWGLSLLIVPSAPPRG